MKIMVRNRQSKSIIGTFTEEKAMTQTNIIVGFKKTGIFPLDEHIFDECDFLPSLVTDQPNDASTSIKHLKENESFHNVYFQRQDLRSLNDVEIQNLETFQNNFLSPEQVIGYPKAPRRKKGCSMILTDTPQKELLKSWKKFQKAPKRKAKNSRKHLYSNKSLNVDDRFFCQTLAMLKKISMSQTALMSLNR